MDQKEVLEPEDNSLNQIIESQQSDIQEEKKDSHNSNNNESFVNQDEQEELEQKQSIENGVIQQIQISIDDENKISQDNYAQDVNKQQAEPIESQEQKQNKENQDNQEKLVNKEISQDNFEVIKADSNELEEQLKFQNLNEQKLSLIKMLQEQNVLNQDEQFNMTDQVCQILTRTTQLFQEKVSKQQSEIECLQAQIEQQKEEYEQKNNELIRGIDDANVGIEELKNEISIIQNDQQEKNQNIMDEITQLSSIFQMENCQLHEMIEQIQGRQFTNLYGLTEEVMKMFQRLEQNVFVDMSIPNDLPADKIMLFSNLDYNKYETQCLNQFIGCLDRFRNQLVDLIDQSMSKIIYFNSDEKVNLNFKLNQINEINSRLRQSERNDATFVKQFWFEQDSAFDIYKSIFEQLISQTSDERLRLQEKRKQLVQLNGQLNFMRRHID